MSDADRGGHSAGTDVAGFLATVPLLDGFSDGERAELGRVMRRRRLGSGEILWRAGEEADSMVLISEGQVVVSLILPGDRAVDLARLGPREVLGEIPLLDGGQHSATVRAEQPVELLSLSRADFEALVSRRHPSSFALKRRIAAIVCTRLRLQLADLAASLAGGDGGGYRAAPAAAPAQLERCPPPDSRYLRRLATFHAFDSLALRGLVSAGRFVRCPPGNALIGEGADPTACYLTINGAVEKVVVRGARRIRVGLAGPGQAFGYEGLIDGLPSPLTATTRERSLLLVLPRDAFARLFEGQGRDSHMFLDVIQRELSSALRQALRPHARLAVSV